MDTNKRIKELESLIEKNIALYYNNSNKAVSNIEFDSWVEELEYLNPDSPVLNIMENNMGDYEKVVLPFRLYSQRKTKTWTDISNWINSTLSEMKKLGLENKDLKLVITPKLDGIHLMEYNKNTFTRGEDGIEGYKVSSRTKYFLNIENGYNELAFGGEIITSKKVYKEYFETAGYTSPRNLIQSFFSNLEVPKNIDKVDYIRYSIYNKELDKDEQLEICNIVNKIKIEYKILNVWDLSEEYLDSLFEKWSEFYNIDGLVIDINDYQTRKALGYRNKYPKFSISFKPERYNQELTKTKINNIRLQISRYGKIAPVAEVDSVLINNGNVTNVSLYNMKYVYDNNICIGQEGFVFRSGSINPKFKSFIPNDNLIPFKVDYCPFCGSKLVWDENHVDLNCVNKECKEILCQQIYFFFKTIGVKDFGLKSIQAFVYKGNFKSIIDFFNEDLILKSNIEGIGQISKNKFLDELDKLKEEGVALEKIQEASGCFEGIASSTFKLLNKLNIDIEFLYKDSYYNEILSNLTKIEGVGEITAEEYLYGLPEFWKFYFTLKEFITIKKEKKQLVDLSNYRVVFTGFRDEELKNYIENNGGKVLSSVSSNCTYLITKNINSTSSKIEKAKSLGINVISIDELKTLILK